MKPYSFTPTLNNIEKKFDNKLSSFRGRSFGICKARCRCLLKTLFKKVENVSDVIITCFVLHTFCQINGTTYHDQDGILEDLIQKEMEIRRTRGLNNIALPDGERLRPALRNYIEENF